MNPQTLALMVNLTASLNDIIITLRDNPEATPEDIADLHANNTALANVVMDQLSQGIEDPDR